MKVLILDDETYRHTVFDRILQDHDVYHAYTVRQFIHALQGHVFDMISFDHDLGTNETGLDAARYLIHKVDRERWPSKCLVHSWNPVGGQNIFEELQAAGLTVVRREFGGAARQ